MEVVLTVGVPAVPPFETKKVISTGENFSSQTSIKLILIMRALDSTPRNPSDFSYGRGHDPNTYVITFISIRY